MASGILLGGFILFIISCMRASAYDSNYCTNSNKPEGKYCDPAYPTTHYYYCSSNGVTSHYDCSTTIYWVSGACDCSFSADNTPAPTTTTTTTVAPTTTTTTTTVAPTTTTTTTVAPTTTTTTTVAPTTTTTTTATTTADASTTTMTTTVAPTTTTPIVTIITGTRFQKTAGQKSVSVAIDTLHGTNVLTCARRCISTYAGSCVGVNFKEISKECEILPSNGSIQADQNYDYYTLG